jgi:hypothetical protein
MSFGQNKPHPRDGKVVDDLPNIVEDEEGFEVARFRFYHDAEAYVAAVNGEHPCAEYSIREP